MLNRARTDRSRHELYSYFLECFNISGGTGRRFTRSLDSSPLALIKEGEENDRSEKLLSVAQILAALDNFLVDEPVLGDTNVEDECRMWIVCHTMARDVANARLKQWVEKAR